MGDAPGIEAARFEPLGDRLAGSEMDLEELGEKAVANGQVVGDLARGWERLAAQLDELLRGEAALALRERPENGRPGAPASGAGA